MNARKWNMIGALTIHSVALVMALYCHLMPVYLVLFLFVWANNLALRLVK